VHVLPENGDPALTAEGDRRASPTTAPPDTGPDGTPPPTVVEPGGTTPTTAEPSDAAGAGGGPGPAAPPSTAPPVRGSAGAPAPKAPATTAAPPPTAPPPPPPPTTRPAVSGRFMGNIVSTLDGPVLVTAVVSNGRLVDVVFGQYPDDTAQRRAYSYLSLPVLRDRSVAAQSWDVATVSQATYTSDAYRKSLKAALAQAGLL
jgi:uncharacterized protein with FMN-binding domain